VTLIAAETEVLNSLTPEQSAPKMVVSIYPQGVSIMHTPTGTHEFAACPKDETSYSYAMVNVVPGMHKDLAGLGHIKIFDTSAEDFAWDVIGVSRAMRKGSKTGNPEVGSDWYKRGFFVPAGDEPTLKELKAARERLKKWCEIQVSQGDGEYSNRQQISDVSSSAKVAAEYLGISRPWASGNAGDTNAKMKCPGCMNEINAGATVCQFCGRDIVYGKDGKATLAGK
jgi:hypothetical protein